MSRCSCSTQMRLSQVDSSLPWTDESIHAELTGLNPLELGEPLRWHASVSSCHRSQRVELQPWGKRWCLPGQLRVTDLLLPFDVHELSFKQGQPPTLKLSP